MSKTFEFEYDADTVVEALLFLVSRYQKTPESTIRQAIIEHMAMLEHHPQVTSTSLRSTARRLGRFWSCECDLKNREAVQALIRPEGESLH